MLRGNYLLIYHQVLAKYNISCWTHDRWLLRQDHSFQPCPMLSKWPKLLKKIVKTLVNNVKNVSEVTGHLIWKIQSCLIIPTNSFSIVLILNWLRTIFIVKHFNWESITRNKLHEVRRIQNPVEHQRWGFLQIISWRLKDINYFHRSSILDVRLGSEYSSVGNLRQ